MTQFAKLPREVLDILPPRLVVRYAWLDIATDFRSGAVGAASWAELAVLMKCSEAQSRRAVASLVDAGVVKGAPPSLVLTHRVRTSESTSESTSANTPIYQKDTDSHFQLWADFVEGRRGRRPVEVNRVPSKFLEAVRGSGLGYAELREVCRLAGESYADWRGAVNYENALDRGIEAQSIASDRPMTAKEWLDD